MPFEYFFCSKGGVHLSIHLIHYAIQNVLGEIIWESALLTTAVVIALTIYTFWASRRGYDFSFLGPFLFAGLIILILFILIQVQINGMYLDLLFNRLK